MELRMARLNIEDSLLSSEDFRLYERKIGDPDKAIGSWVRAARLAQKYWIEDKLIPYEIWSLHEISDMLIKYGLAEKRGDEIYLKGSEKHFAWIKSKIENGKKGGRPSKSKQLTKANHNLRESDDNPLTLTLTPTLTQKEKKESPVSDFANKIKLIIEYFNDTTGKKFKPEEDEIVRVIIPLLKRNYTIADFVHVIDVKHAEWRDDPKMASLIRPITLFANDKFSSYLNQEKIKTVEDCDNALLALFEGTDGN